jgi:hypothetical protein
MINVALAFGYTARGGLSGRKKNNPRTVVVASPWLNCQTILRHIDWMKYNCFQCGYEKMNAKVHLRNAFKQKTKQKKSISSNCCHACAARGAMPSRTHPFQCIRANQTKGCVHNRGQVKPPESGAISFDEKPQAITPESLHGRLKRQQIVKERCSWLIGQLLRNLGIIEQGYNHPGKLRARDRQAKQSKAKAKESVSHTQNKKP